MSANCTCSSATVGGKRESVSVWSTVVHTCTTAHKCTSVHVCTTLYVILGYNLEICYWNNYIQLFKSRLIFII